MAVFLQNVSIDNTVENGTISMHEAIRNAKAIFLFIEFSINWFSPFLVPRQNLKTQTQKSKQFHTNHQNNHQIHKRHLIFCGKYHSFLQSGSVLNLYSTNTTQLFGCNFQYTPQGVYFSVKKNVNTLPRVGMNCNNTLPRGGMY